MIIEARKAAMSAFVDFFNGRATLGRYPAARSI
jgi:hypothetical protein